MERLFCLRFANRTYSAYQRAPFYKLRQRTPLWIISRPLAPLLRQQPAHKPSKAPWPASFDLPVRGANRENTDLRAGRLDTILRDNPRRESDSGKLRRVLHGRRKIFDGDHSATRMIDPCDHQIRTDVTRRSDGKEWDVRDFCDAASTSIPRSQAQDAFRAVYQVTRDSIEMRCRCSSAMLVTASFSKMSAARTNCTVEMPGPCPRALSTCPLPGIQRDNTRRCEINNVACHHSHAMHQRRSSDEGITL